MLCGIDSIPRIIPSFSMKMGIFYGILSIPQNIVMNLNNVMKPWC